MDLIMGGLDTADLAPAIPARPQPRKRKSSPISSSSPGHYPMADSSFTYDQSSDGDDLLVDDGRMELKPTKRPRTQSAGSDAAIEGLDGLHVKEEVDYDSFFDDVGNDQIMEPLNLEISPVKTEVTSLNPDQIPNGKGQSASDNPPSWLSLHSSLKTTVEDTLGKSTKPITNGPITSANVLEAGGTFHFFWLDYLEVEGKIYLVGKARDKKACCVDELLRYCGKY